MILFVCVIIFCKPFIRFGCAFLSTDAGNTFLDDGAAEEWNTDTDKSPPSGMSKYPDDSSSSSSSSHSMNGGMLERNVTSSSSNRPRSTSSYSTTSSDGGYNNIKRKQIEELKESNNYHQIIYTIIVYIF